MRHTALLNQQRQEWEHRGHAVYVEGQNAFRLRGKSAILAGRSDLVMLDDCDGTIIDVKTGQERPWHRVQVIMYILEGNQGPNKIYALPRGDQSINVNSASASFTVQLSGVNVDNRGLWSNGTTMWIANDFRRLLAHRLVDDPNTTANEYGAYDSGKNFTWASSVGGNARGLWSNSETMWVSTERGSNLLAFKMSDHTRDADKDISLRSENADPQGIWSDGTWMWVIDRNDKRIYAYEYGRATEQVEATGTPTITGTLEVGETLTADTSGIADENGIPAGAFEFQWLADDADIQDATGSTYTLIDADEGKHIKVQVSFTDYGGNAGGPLTSPAVGPVAAINYPATGRPTVTGTLEVGRQLTADTSAIMDRNGIPSGAFRYQWLYSDGTDAREISGADGRT